MKITRQFKDYYDGVQGHGGFDGDLIFVRHPEEYKASWKVIPPSKRSEYVGRPEWLSFLGHSRLPFDTVRIDRTKAWSLSVMEVAFCGVLYRGLTARVRDWPYPSDEPRPEDKHFWLFEAFDRWAAATKLVEGLRWAVPNALREPKTVVGNKKLEEYFEPVRNDDRVLRAMVEKRVPIASFEPTFSEHTYTVNGNLGRLNFQQVMPPQLAYQELFMFLGNFAPENKPIAQVEDKYKIQGHGFDHWSFRKQGKNSV